jgi:hypothetical protein
MRGVILMNNKTAQDNIKVEDLIYEIRGKQVMLDSDLAKLYKCTNGTKDINKAVKRNINKFPDDFYFKLNDSDMENFWFQLGTKKIDIETRGGRYKNPYVFTEQGIAMLASILHTNIADEISIRIMRVFISMRHYISNNLIEQKYINNLVLENKESIKEIKTDVKLLQESFNKFEEKRKINEIYFNGQIFDAYSKIKEIFKEANNNLIIIDAYADNTILNIIKTLNISVTIITKQNNLLTNQDINKYNKQYHNLKVIFNNTFHDRYFILDNSLIYHCGASINRIGYKTFSITLLSDKEVCELLINKINTLFF